MALVEMRGDSVMLVAASRDALNAGVRSGMTATAARSLLPNLALLEQNSTAEQGDFEALAAAQGRFTPRVHMDCPNALLLEIGGCARLFGSEAALVAGATALAEKLGYSVSTGVAANPTAAYALALGGGDDLGGAPVSALRLEQADLGHLAALGVRTIGELQALPLESLPARFSQKLLRRLRELRGDAYEDFPAFRPPQFITERLDFVDATDRHDQLIFALRRVAVALEERLSATGTGALVLETKLRATEGAAVCFSMVLARPTRDSRSLTSLLLGRMESVDTGERWFDGVEVTVPTQGPIRVRQQDLFGESDPVDAREFTGLLDELAGRLGVEAVARAELTADPRPEKSYVYHPFVQTSGEAANANGTPARPASVFEPHEVSVECNESGQPVRWQEGRRASQLRSTSPERVHFGWWAGDGDERDYFVVTDEAGSRWWLMRRGEHWYIVGAF